MFVSWTSHEPIPMRPPTPARAILILATMTSAMLAAARLARSQIPKPTDAPRPMSPEQSAAAFKLPDGFRMEAVASAPLIASPSAVCWDERGRMLVRELHGYTLEGPPEIAAVNKSRTLPTQ